MADLKKLGRYEVSAYIFSDEFADTYIAYDTLLDRKVILKTFTDEITSDRAFFESFLREVRIAADLVHPNIIWLWDIGIEKKHYYLAMRYFEGKAVSKVMDNQGPIPWGDALYITKQVANALQFVHNRGFVHGNVNTRNILISESKEAVLTDFGFSSASLHQVADIKDSRVTGLPTFIPPEAWEEKQISTSGDQYALAWTLVEMLTGRRLYEDASLQEMRVVPEEPLQLWETWPVGVPSHIVEILQNALDSDPSNRFADIETFSAELRKTAYEPTHELPSEKTETQVRVPEMQVKPLPPGTDEIAKFRLIAQIGPRIGNTFPLVQEKVTIGRESGNDIMFNDPAVSRVHAVLSAVKDGYEIEDLESMNGTYIDGKRLQTIHKLKDGELIMIGKSVVLKFEEVKK